MGIGDHQLDTRQPARDQPAQELAPEGLGLGGADIEGDHLAIARLVDGVGDHEGLSAHAPSGSRTFSTLASSHR